jgi:NTE family protein
MRRYGLQPQNRDTQSRLKTISSRVDGFFPVEYDTMQRQFKIALALGGGGARAFSHIGVIAALERAGIPIDLVTGTSMGAIIGAIYTSHLDVELLKQRIADYVESEEFADSGLNFFRELDTRGEGLLSQATQLVRRGVFNTLMVTRTALVNEKTAQDNFAFLVDDLDIRETRIPFAAVALDLISGRQVVLDQGRMRQAIGASCAMPGVLNPVKIGDRLLVDGGWVEAVPISAALQLGADFVIAAEVGDAPESFQSPRNTLDVIARADALTRCALANEQLKSADFVLAPKNGVRHWADFSSVNETIKIGEQEVNRKLGSLRDAIRMARWRWRLRLGRKKIVAEPTTGKIPAQ